MLHAQEVISSQTLGARIAGAEALLLERDAAVVQHSRWSLQQHLLATLGILEAWDQPPEVQLAGLLHSVYSTDAFSTALVSTDERDLVRDTIGDAAERLVHLFCSIDRDAVFASVEPDSALPSSATLTHRLTGEALELSRADLEDILVLHLANLAEQTCAPTGAPAPWIAAASRIGKALEGRTGAVPPVFAGCTATVTTEQERRLGKAYAAAISADGFDFGTAHAELSAAAASVPYLAEPFIWSGLLSLAQGDAVAAAACGNAAVNLLERWNVAWDKRLSAMQWQALAHLLQTAGLLEDRNREFVARRITQMLRGNVSRPEGIWARLDALGALGTPVAAADAVTTTGASGDPDLDALDESDFDELPKRFAEYLVGLRDIEDNPSMSMYPNLTAKPWWNAGEVALAVELERMAPQIIAEFEAIDPERFHPESEPISRNGKWDIFLLYERGRRHDDRCKLVPTTAAIIDAHRTVRTLGGLIYFSRMGPQTMIGRHRGPTNLRLRCHLGIHVPPQCGITVGGVTETWQTGKCLIFDDSFAHEAWNGSDRERVVLIVDFWHPDLSEYEVRLLHNLHQHIAFVSDGLQRYWSHNDVSARLASFD